MLAIRAARAFDGERFLADGATVLVNGSHIVGVEGPHCEVPTGCAVRQFDDAD